MNGETPKGADNGSQIRQVSTVADALWQEFTTLHGGTPPPVKGVNTAGGAQDPYSKHLSAYYDAALDKGQTALCLSGGGIRSAAFSLGILQALARKRLLTQFHYLSTVSGGGYIGGWLTALIHAHKGNVEAVQTILGKAGPSDEVGRLRQFTNFLTPQPGLASVDTWSGIILWVRNVLINWMLFLPALLALALVPVLYRDLIATLSPDFGYILLVVALLCLGFAVYFAVSALPSHDAETDRRNPFASTQASTFAVRRVVWPVMAWSFLVPLVAAPSLRLVMPPGTASISLIPVGCFVVMIAAYILAGFRIGNNDLAGGPPLQAAPDAKRAKHRHMLFLNFVPWTIACLIACIVLNVGLGLGLNQTPAVLAVFGPVWVTMAHLVQSLFYVALRSESFRGDLDREWLGRLSAVKVMPALLWAVFAGVCLLLPVLILNTWSTWSKPGMGLIGILTGPGAAFLGRSVMSASGSSGKEDSTWSTFLVNILLAVCTAVFAILLFMLLAWAGSKLSDAFAPGPSGPTVILPWYRFLVDAALVLLFGGLAYQFGKMINVNRFSMHAVYRTRLVRAFLGSARSRRRPDAFTDIDPSDNPRMSDVFERPKSPPSRVLFPVINLTLNLTAGENTAWNERKAESFTVTPLTSGAAYLHSQRGIRAGDPVRGAYVPTEVFAGNERETGIDDPRRGLSLGTAITLSGAAVSPNMGYHSSAATAFLMTLFNVRLGAWLPNPATASPEQLREAKPPNALRTLASEMLGRAGDQGQAIYLSDGGHFDNLGLYEMLRRRCRYIVVIDAGQDQDAEFGDLGNAARKAFIDFGVRIVFDPEMKIGSRAVPVKPVHSYACADIFYPNEDRKGSLLYIRPIDLPAAPIDVRSFRNANVFFPHESTLDQWFSESRFESYRGLGDAELSGLGLQQGQTGWNTCTLPQFFTDVLEQIRAIKCDEK